MNKILIVEDDKDILELIYDYFVMNNFIVDTTECGKKGLEMGLFGEYDLIILDVMLPEINGFEICRQLRNKINIPILFVSAKDSDIDIIRGLGLGADDYIKKPFIPSELVARVKANIMRYRSLTLKTEENILHFRDIVINLDSMRITKNDKEISLANKEFELLIFFFKNPNKVFSREAIFAKIWDISSFGDTSTVTVHIKRLREKIEDDPNSPELIETIRGAGYRFNK